MTGQVLSADTSLRASVGEEPSRKHCQADSAHTSTEQSQLTVLVSQVLIAVIVCCGFTFCCETFNRKGFLFNRGVLVRSSVTQSIFNLSLACIACATALPWRRQRDFARLLPLK
jgi:hypothetical protein